MKFFTTKNTTLFLVFVIANLCSKSYFSDVYKDIENIYHPTLEDYKNIEKFLQSGKAPYFNQLDNWQYKGKYKNLKLTPPPREKIIHEVISVNCDMADKENCIILYSSLNHQYPTCLLKLVELIKKSDYKGHIIYRLGGWPNIEGGDLTLAHIPFAFKISSFREAYRLGYKKALWLDCVMRPQVSLNTIFEKIDSNGFFTYLSPYTIATHCYTNDHLNALQLTKTKAQQMYTIVAGILGIDFTDIKAHDLFVNWYERTKNDERASFTPRQELTLISQIVNNYYPSSFFRDFHQHVNCLDPINLEFTYSKKEAQPNWPN